MVRPPEDERHEPSQGDHGRTQVYTMSERLA
jgi:hypothetical protein